MSINPTLYCINYGFPPLGTFYAREEHQLQELTALFDSRIEQYVHEEKDGGLRNDFLGGLHFAFYPLQDPEGNLGQKAVIKSGLQSLMSCVPDMKLKECERGEFYVELGGSVNCSSSPLIIPIAPDFDLAIRIETVPIFPQFQSYLRRQKDEDVKGLYQVLTGREVLYFVHYIPADIREGILSLDLGLFLEEAQQLRREREKIFDAGIRDI